MDKFLVVLLGPTGVGKTDISITVAKYFNTEIISCDSRQIYMDMPVGTAVPSVWQLKEVKHHFIEILPPSSYYSASLFERDVLTLLADLFRKNKMVMMVGGSGMYIDAVCNGIDDIPDVDPAVRERYLKKYHEEGIESIRIDLKLLDPDYYQRVDLRNYKRILRALEICETTGRPYSSFLHRQRAERNFRIIKIGLQLERDELYERINRRVDQMMEQGLEEEARRLIGFREYNSLNTVGYRELFRFFDGEISREKAVELIKRNSRRYAKRQSTWWSRDRDIKWFNPARIDEITGFIETNIKGIQGDQLPG